MQRIYPVLRTYFPFLLFAAILGAAAACNKKASSVTPSLPGNEFLTTVELQLVNVNDPTDHPLPSWSQMSPYTHTYQTDSAYFNNAYMSLRANSTYDCYLVILDSTKNPVDSVTP